jgi:hypothetical protein
MLTRRAGEAREERRRALSRLDDSAWVHRATPRQLPRALYCLFVGLGATLTTAQVLVLPDILGARGFGIAVISISISQGMAIAGDFGFGRLSDDTSRPQGERNRFRTLSFASVSMTVAVTVVASVVVAVVSDSTLPFACALGAMTAWLLYPVQLRAQVAESYTDEVGAAYRHFLWQNGTKAGLIAGALITRDPVGCVAGGLVAALVIALPQRPVLSATRQLFALWRVWLPALLSVTAPFVLIWSDTYFVTIAHGIAVGGGYVLIYRILGAVSYLYLPLGSVLLSRLNRQDRRAAWFVPAVSLCLTIPTLLVLSIGLLNIGREVFPGIPLDFQVLLPLTIMNVLASLSYFAGTVLAAYGSFSTIVRCSLIGAAIAIAGHLLFTLHRGLAVAAYVSLVSVGTAALLQVAAAVNARRRGAPLPVATTVDSAVIEESGRALPGL